MKRLKLQVEKDLLASEQTLGKIADHFGVTALAIRVAIGRHSQYLVTPAYMDAIREALCLPADEEITESYTPEIIAE